jgi:hypothetical protein
MTVGEVIDARYLPFDKETLRRHLAKPDKSFELSTPEESNGVTETDSEGIDHYLKSADAYHRCFQQKNPPKTKTVQISIQDRSRKMKNFGPLLAY